MNAACSTFQSQGSHSWMSAPNTTYDRNGDPNDMLCRDCGTLAHDPNPTNRWEPDTNWATATAGYIFADDDF